MICDVCFKIKYWIMKGGINIYVGILLDKSIKDKLVVYNLGNC